MRNTNNKEYAKPRPFYGAGLFYLLFVQKAAIHKALLQNRVKCENGRIYFRITDKHEKFEMWKDKAERIAKEMAALGYGRYVDALDSEANSIFFYCLAQ